MSKKEELEEVAREIATCKTCPLYKTATQPVPGSGNPEAQIVFIGEAPGHWEDKLGLPFVGSSGKLLDQLLASIGLSRQEVFITSILKHRPPGNRDPLPQEIETYRPFLDRQIEIIAPRVIISLGRFAMNLFLPEGKINQEHGQARLIEYRGKKYILIPMYHPAAALRNKKIEEILRKDFLKIPKEILKFEKKD